MERGHIAPITTVVLACTLTVGALLIAPSAKADPTSGEPARAHAFSFAVIGDVPYGDEAQSRFPDLIAEINADPDVRMVTHLGDIKSGSTTCDDQRFDAVRQDFDAFRVPLVYTPGDNEWTDCHRANNGSYHPLERLARIRSLFFPRPGRTLGKPTHVFSQADVGVPENVRYVRAGVSFATLHVVGSNDDLAPWFGLGETSPAPTQITEERSRMRAAIANVRAAFQRARASHLRGVVLQQQADMFDPTVTAPKFDDYSAFTPLVKAIVHESHQFDGPVYLFNGDSHRFNVDRPLASGSPWLDFYGVDQSADNLRRVTVDGSDLGEADWLKVTVEGRGADLLTFERVPGL
ncbi:MAG: hypothetical protein QOF53_184 [Nocardioidaceae bacterium]|nr:hypothetical protein [Nocardioidaceae bacterium]